MASYLPAKKNTAYRTYIALVDQSNTKLLKANPTIASGDFKVSTDGGAFANLATLPSAVPASGRSIQIDLSNTEMNGDDIVVQCVDAAGAEWCDLLVNIQTTARQIDDLAFPTTSGRSLDVTATGEAGIDWSNVGAPTTTVDLTGTTIKTTQKVDVDTIKTNPVVNAGTITFPTTATLASTTNITAGTVTTATNLTNAATSGDFTATMKTSIGTAVAVSAVASVTGNVGGNVTGSVGSVVGAVGSVIGAVGSVTGAVGSVTGNVGGNVIGTVASVVGAVGSVTGAVGSVTGAVGSVTGAVGSVTGNVGGNVTGSVASVLTGGLIDLTSTTYAESSGIPAATSSLKDDLVYLKTLARNKITQTSTTSTLRNDGDSGNVGTSTVSDDGATFTRGKWG